MALAARVLGGEGAAGFLPVAISFLSLALGLPAGAQVPGGRGDGSPLEVPRAVSPISVDGKLDEPAWDHALMLELPYEIMPGENIPAPVLTECVVTHDDRNLYVGFRAYDPEPSLIRAHLADRDQTFRNDYVGIIVDPFNDERRAFEFFCNPLGIQTDLTRNEAPGDSYEDATWDAIWASAGRIGEEGYIVEMAIPFNSLRFPRTNGRQTWGFVAFRAYPRVDRHQIASAPYDRNLPGILCQIHKIVGFEGVSPGRNLELTPTITAGRPDEREDFPSGPMTAGEPDVEVGLSTRWGITPNLSLNVALNPDFSQVEADVAQLDINTRDALYYPEKRPFFLEGADIFRTPFEVIYTRTVAEPSYGIKLSGKEGGSAVGAFVTRDDLNNLLLPGNQSSDVVTVAQDVTNGVLRYRRDVGAFSNLGTVMTLRESHGYGNVLAGVDGKLQCTSTDQISFQFLGSQTGYPASFAEENEQPREIFNGLAWDVTYDHSARDWGWWVYGHTRDPGFRADAGFVPRVDIRQLGLGVVRSFWLDPDSRLNRVWFVLEGHHADNHRGRLTDQSSGLEVNVEGPWQSYLNLEVSRNREWYEGTSYKLRAGSFFFNIRPTGDFTCSVGGRLEEAIDYDHSRPAELIRVFPGFTYNLGRHLYLQWDYEFRRLNVSAGRLFDAHLHQTRLVYQLNSRTFTRLILQYEGIDRNPGLFTDPETEAESRDLFAQLLFSYKVNPQTVLFLGYTDSREGNQEISLTQSERAFFFKLGYAWVR